MRYPASPPPNRIRVIQRELTGHKLGRNLPLLPAPEHAIISGVSPCAISWEPPGWCTDDYLTNPYAIISKAARRKIADDWNREIPPEPRGYQSQPTDLDGLDAPTSAFLTVPTMKARW